MLDISPITCDVSDTDKGRSRVTYSELDIDRRVDVAKCPKREVYQGGYQQHELGFL